MVPGNETTQEVESTEEGVSVYEEEETAEAAPPDNELSMEELYEESFKHIQEGEILPGHVVQIERDSVLVDVGYKSEGFIPLEEFPNRGRDLKVGDAVKVFLESTEDNEGMIVLSKEKADRIRIWDDLAEAFEGGTPVKGRVVSRIKGGLTVDVGLRAFLPGSQVDLRPVRNLDKLIGQELEMKIIKLNRKRGNIVLSRRVLLEEVREEAKKKTIEILQEGMQMEGIVKNLTEYGAFIDLGGIDGLLHITDMSWGRINHPQELFTIGDKVEVVVLKFDKERERVSLGYKQLLPDPWDEVDLKYPVGSRVNGTVVSITDYGAFVELEEGVEGLVHVSEMSWNKRVRHASKIVSVGDAIEAIVLNLDTGERRISLGMKQTEPNPWDTIEERYPIGSLVEGKVRNLTDFGAFVTLEDGIDGLIHISDLTWNQKIKDPSEVLRKNEAIEVKVLSIDKENERLSLGLKQLTPDPWETVSERYSLGNHVEGEVVKVTNFGAFAEIEEGIEGLIHVSELAPEKVANPKDVISEGDSISAKIIKIDLENRKIGLSVKAYMTETGNEGITKAPDPLPVAEEEEPVEAQPEEVEAVEAGETPLADETPPEAGETPLADETPPEAGETPLADETPPEAGETPLADETPPEAGETSLADETPPEAEASGADTEAQEAPEPEETEQEVADSSPEETKSD